ncbi:uncharacterized protein ENSP00000471857-like [Microcaecilia unicolor]|uniref:Uncharacterized protein ENSP00000471857-like n=1 Tax=Microcaecilia unicolor TaxID=1415580 RepID=A0A6P7ZDT9_9AMPH|nr:uncharacterized protein ENSP00000471857-like [Microcaecilia unicolor]
MNGATNVNPVGRSHYASSIPVPRTMSQGKLHSMVASPKMPPKQSSVTLGSPLAFHKQKTSSPRLGKVMANISGSPLEASRQKCASKTPIGIKEKVTVGQEKAHLHDGRRGDNFGGSFTPSGGSPWSSPRMLQKASPRARDAHKKILVHGMERDKEKEDCDKLTQSVSGHVNKNLGKSSLTFSMVTETSQLQAKATARLSLYTETVLMDSAERLKIKRPQSCPVKGQWVCEMNRETSKPTIPNDKTPVELPVPRSSPLANILPQNKGPILNSGAKSFLPVTQQSRPVTATVAPFQHRRDNLQNKDVFVTAYLGANDQT